MQLTIDRVTVKFPYSDDSGQTLQALGPISFSVESSTFVALLGPSGSGKSTLIRVLAGLQAATTGQALIDGKAVNQPRHDVGLMFQEANLMPWRTVLDNIALPLELKNVPKPERETKVRALLPLLGLQEFASAYPAELSGGMAQRAALGRVLIQQPDVLLLDEPFGALDALTRETISLDLLRLWAQGRQTAMMVTHDINEAVLLADRVMILSQRPGRLVADLPVPLPRPRTLDMIYSAPFIETAKAVRAAIDRA